ncbi:MAG TPA: hypothetical protein VH189_03305 [Rhizomicrobium sp.]|nr:hypothetical protein [Rhizomicrobium sp.]
MRKMIGVGTVALMVFAAPAWAGPREDNLTGVSRCASLPNDRTFLDCVYGAVQPLRARPGLPPAPAAQQRLVLPDVASRSTPPPNAAAIPPQQSENVLGMFPANGLPMAAYRFDQRGLFIVTLSNGSVWRQDANDTNFAHFGGQTSR